MAEHVDDLQFSVGAWAKKYHLTSRTLMESILREHDLGPTQWYVLYQLVNSGPTLQRELGAILKLERATLSGIVAALVRKGLVDQAAHESDQRQRLLSVTDEGRALWSTLPGPVSLVARIAFDGAAEDDLELARRVLETATLRLQQHMAGRAES